MNKRITIILLLSLLYIPVFPVGGAEDTGFATMRMLQSDISKTDRLFLDMGIFKLLSLAPPVDIHLTDVNGKLVRVSDLKGKIVFLNFWTTWCPPCRVEMPAMQKLHQRLKDKDFVMIAINLQEPSSRVKAFNKKHKLSFTSLLDSSGEVGLRFGVRSIPITYILDKKGGMIGKALGAREWDSEKSIALFEHLMSQKDDTLS